MALRWAEVLWARTGDGVVMADVLPGDLDLLRREVERCGTIAVT